MCCRLITLRTGKRVVCLEKGDLFLIKSKWENDALIYKGVFRGTCLNCRLPQKKDSFSSG